MMLMMRAIFFSLALSLAVCVAGAAHDDLGSSSSTLCVHKASTQRYDGVVALQDGSGRLICWNKNGAQAWLATMDTGGILRVGDKPFLDLGSRVSQDAARGRGFAGVAVDSTSRGRLFVSYYTTVAPNGSTFLVVDQLQSSASSWNDEATTRVFSMALPQVATETRSASGFPLDYYGGQIMFRPTATDPFLYVVTGAAQTDGQLEAKILRFSVGDKPSSGNGTNTPQIYAAGLGVPRRCAFDADKPSDLYCAIVKDDQELVYLISDPDAPSYSATPPSPSLLVANQRPTPGTPPSLVGGLLYRGYADKSMTGSYIYMDGSEFWVTARNHSTTRTCSASAPATTTTSPCRGGDFAGAVTSFGEDADKNALLLATDGVYLVVGPTLCDKAQPPTSTSNLLKWIIVVISSLIGTSGVGYGAYKKCSFCNRRKTNNIYNVTGNTFNIQNGNST